MKLTPELAELLLLEGKKAVNVYKNPHSSPNKLKKQLKLMNVPADLEWDLLYPHEKRNLIRSIPLTRYLNRNEKFDTEKVSEKIPFLKLPLLNGDQASVVLQSNNLTEPAENLEFHYRTIEKPSRSIIDLAHNNRHEDFSIHVHLLSKMPETISGNAVQDAFSIIYIHHLVNWITELTEFLEWKIKIKNIETPNSTLFRFMSTRLLFYEFETLMNLFDQNDNDKSTDDNTEEFIQFIFKYAAVGLRLPGSYDDPQLWGLEVRTLTSQTVSHSQMPHYVDLFNKVWKSEGYMNVIRNNKKWVDGFKNPDNVFGLLTYLMWYRNEDQIEPPIYLKSLLKPNQLKKIIDIVSDHSKENGIIQMLVYDFRYNPVFGKLENKKLKQLIDLQVKAIREILSGRDWEDALADWITKSHLLEYLVNDLKQYDLSGEK